MDLTGKTVFVCRGRSYNGLVSEWRLHDSTDLNGLLRYDGKDIKVIDESVPDEKDGFTHFVERHFNGRLLSSNDYQKKIELAEIPCAEDYGQAIGKLGDGVEKVLVKSPLDDIPDEHQTDMHGERTVVMNRFVVRNVSYRLCLLDSSPAALQRFFRDKLRALKGFERKPHKQTITHLQTGRLCSSLFSSLPAAIKNALEMQSPAWTRSVLYGAAYAYDLLRLSRRYGKVPVRQIRKELKGIDLEATKRAWRRWAGKNQAEWTSASHRKAFRLIPMLAQELRRRP